ncbi:SMI1/KNR4 family protein [Kitasatospora sp. NPDC002227]|uniref:SMI1/KNR4 family protein n=1 Tax=Kitasatospora sp. NPDC002227 TaxID=3154773 RepID=UPI00332132FF
MPALHDFATWEPLLALLRTEHADRLAVGTGHVTGRVSTTGWSLPLSHQGPAAEAAPVQRALAEAGVGEVLFAADFAPDGRTELHVFVTGPAVEPRYGGVSPAPGTLLLAEGAVAAPWRRLPEPVPAAAPAPSADPALLERTLRERLPGAVAATEEEFAAAEQRLGVPLPEELKALYRAVGAEPGALDGWPPPAALAIGCEAFPLELLFLAEAAPRAAPWEEAATTVAVAAPDAAVQTLAGSPGWIVFGTNGGDCFAVDLTPGPRGHLGQVVLINHGEYIGAELWGESLTQLVLNGFEQAVPAGRAAVGEGQRLPHTAWIGDGRDLAELGPAAHPDLEVVEIFSHSGPPLGLAPIAGLPKVRTLVAYPGTLASPLEVAGLTGLEYLGLGAQEWRVLLDAGAVPAGLSAAGIEVRGDEHPLAVVEVANELLALRGRQPIARTSVKGRLPAA